MWQERLCNINRIQKVRIECSKQSLVTDILNVSSFYVTCIINKHINAVIYPQRSMNPSIQHLRRCGNVEIKNSSACIFQMRESFRSLAARCYDSVTTVKPAVEESSAEPRGTASYKPRELEHDGEDTIAIAILWSRDSTEGCVIVGKISQLPRNLLLTQFVSGTT